MTDQLTEPAPNGAAQASGCPVFPAFDPLAPQHLSDPWPILARARKEQPVFYMPSLDMWCVTRYEDIKTVLFDTTTFSNNGGNQMKTEVPPEITLPSDCPFPTVGLQIVNQDPPRHDRARQLMSYAFTPRRVNQFAPFIREYCMARIDEFIDKGTVDLVPNYSNLIPVAVVAKTLGFPPDEAAANFRTWSEFFMELLTHPQLPHDRSVVVWSALIDYHAYLKDYVERRRREPSDDLISDMIRAKTEDGQPGFSNEEIVDNLIGLIVAGSDTTATQIAHQVILLQEDRSRWEAVVADPSLIPNVVEETLRYLGPVRGLNRVVTKDTELAGVAIPKGARLFWMGSSANRDETVFENPDVFDIYRKNNTRHMGFSLHKHFCIGAPLARLEARIALECLIERIPDLRLVDQVVEYPVNFLMPGPLNLTVEWTPQG